MVIHYRRLALLFILCSGSLCGSSQSPSESSPVAMFRNDPQLTGESHQPAIYRLKGIVFRHAFGAPIRSTPAVFGNRVFVGCGDGTLYCLDAGSGKVLWGFPTGGPVYSSPAASASSVYFSSRDGYVYSLSSRDGKLRWKFKMGPDLGKENYWDNYLSSPVIAGPNLFIGSGDGCLYALESVTGKVIWKYSSGAKIRTTPALSGDHVVFGNNAGNLFDLDRRTGALRWKFATDGASNTFESKNNDRTSIYCSASIAQGMVVSGGRDAIVYGLDLNSGKEKWRYDHKGPWILSTAIKGAEVFVGCGSDLLVQALDLQTGKEKWRLKNPSAVFSSITVAGDMLYYTDINFSGNLHAVNTSGVEKWTFPVGSKTFSTPVVAGGMIYCGTEDGAFYGLEGDMAADSASRPAARYVYWQGRASKSDYLDFGNGIDQHLRDYFTGSGYRLVNAEELVQVMKDQSAHPSGSVIVFADNRFPRDITDEAAGKPLVLQYLEAHGKIALFGLNPAAYIRDSAGNVVQFNDSIPEAVFGIKYAGKKFIRGIYQTHATPEGMREGLFSPFTTISNNSVIEPGKGIAVLAEDEFGAITGWIKNYGGPPGTGLLQLSLPINEVNYDPGQIRAVIEYGISW
ncbi:MAG: PQQ-binding-like beta-propeller repeat protein [Bacteroidota bacterium]|nr:PQQ-binding-like beta-propeller repeat protein [Bacteroidota bacterium]MDP4246559.1 PQQ-binding-like beta-propeller repeat protein [Bacteroidota bacterium]MDP4260436.1 PQQ-binding-like beta-propeller repeat protein [Bacteroidota bacterium]